jgi:apolipoprotein N-acyltransferase
MQQPVCRVAACLLSGALLFACFPLLNWHPLVWVACLPMLAALVSEKRPWRGFWLGYLAGVVFWVGSCYWFVNVMMLHGGLGPVLAVGALLLFTLLFSTFFGAFGLAVTWLASRSVGRALVASPFLWVAMELGRVYLITGFPWNLLGYAVQADGLRQLASITAVYGLSFLAVATSALLLALLRMRRRGLGWAVGTWVILLVTANWLARPPQPPRGAETAYLVQPNVPLDSAALEAWVPWRNPAQLERLVAMTVESVQKGGADPARPPLVVWSENPAPFYFDRDPLFRGAVERMARQARSYVVVGTVNFYRDDTTRPRNTAVVVDPDGRVLLQYDKIHLVPFGEYVPWWAFPDKVGKITHEVGNFVPGTSYEVAQTPHGAIGVFICYESIFPELVRRIVAEGAGVLVTISNDTWYGSSSAAYQHLEMARLRAIENGRYVLRATNDGVTAVIDPYGRVLERTPRQRAMVLVGNFDYRVKKTFYTAYGDVFAWLCVSMALLFGTEQAWHRRGAQ